MKNRGRDRERGGGREKDEGKDRKLDREGMGERWIERGRGREGEEKKETRGNTKCGHEVRVKRPTKLSKGKKRFVTRLYDGMLKVCVCEREREREEVSVSWEVVKKRGKVSVGIWHYLDELCRLHHRSRC